MPRKKSQAEEIVPQTPAAPGTYKIDFPNDDGSVDEWIYDTTRFPWRTKQVTQNIRRRPVTEKK